MSLMSQLNLVVVLMRNRLANQSLHPTAPKALGEQQLQAPQRHTRRQRPLNEILVYPESS